MVYNKEWDLLSFLEENDMPEDMRIVRTVKRFIRIILLLTLLAAVMGALYIYLLPMLESQKVQSYDAYVVKRGSISTTNSFSATISIASSETHKNTARATSIREIYVTNGQGVRKGDKLMLLDNGELLKAGLDGVVTEMRFDTTDWLWNNVDLIQISDLTNLTVSLSVDEYDVRNVSAGQTCLVTIVPTGEVFETKISHVDRVSSSSGQVAFYTVTADLTVPESVLPGMTASVTIPSDFAEDTLILDMAALAFDEEKQPYVLHKNDASYQKVPVTTGLSDGMQVQILSGLTEGDTVWAVSGVEETKRAISLTDLYKRLVGEKIVIHDMTGNDRGGRSGAPGMPTPDRNQEAPQGTPSPEMTGPENTDGTTVLDATSPTATPAFNQQEEKEETSDEESTVNENPRKQNQEGNRAP